MRKEDMVEAIVTAHRQRKKAGISAGSRRNWPLCIKCGRPVDSVAMEELTGNYLEIRVKHHGAEDYAKIKFPSSEYRQEHIQQCLRSIDWFQQSHKENTAKK